MAHSENMGDYSLLPPAITESLESDVRKVEDDFESGRALGVPAVILCGVEVDYNIARTFSDTHEEAAADFGLTMRQVRERQEKLTQYGPAIMQQDLLSLQPISPEERARQERWLAQVEEGFSVQELVMYFGYKKLSRLTLGDGRLSLDYCARQRIFDPTETLEPRFGKDIHQEGHYDAKGSPEKRTQPGTPSLTLRRAQFGVETMRQTAAYYGLGYKASFSHFNFSVNTLGKNDSYRCDHSLFTEEGRESARHKTSAILGSLADATIIKRSVSGQPMLQRNAHVYDASVTRDCVLRVLVDRMESREEWGGLDRLPAQLLTLASGYMYAAKHPATEVVPVTVAERPWFMPGKGFDKQKDLGMLRIFQNATLTSEGRLSMRESDAQHITVLKGLASICDLSQLRRMHYEPSLLEAAKSLVRTIRLSPEGGLICDPDAHREWLANIQNEDFRRLLSQHDSPALRADKLTERLGRLRPTTVHEVSGGPVAVDASYRTWPTLLSKFENSELLEGFSLQSKALLKEYFSGRITPQEAALKHAEHLLTNPELLDYDEETRTFHLESEESTAMIVASAEGLEEFLRAQIGNRQVDPEAIIVEVDLNVQALLQETRQSFYDYQTRGELDPYQEELLTRKLSFYSALARRVGKVQRALNSR